MEENLEQHENSNLNKSRFLLLSVLVANLATFTGGTCVAWSSQALVKLNGKKGPENNPLDHNITTTEESLIASVISAGIILVAPFAGPISDTIGRKGALLLGAVINVLAYIFIAFADEVWMFIVARTMNGLAIGTIFVVLPNFAAEITEKNNRGFFGAFLTANLAMGKMLMFAMGPYLSLMVSSFVAIIPALVFLVGFSIFIPESPYFLLAKGRAHEAEVSLSKFRMVPKEQVQEELLEITKSVKESFERKSGYLDLVKSKFLRKRLFLVMFLFTFQQISGSNNIIFYMENIFRASKSSLKPEQASIIVGVIQFVSTFFTPPLLERLGRRFMLFASTVIMTISLAGLSAFFFIDSAGQSIDNITWLPIVCLVTFIVGFNLGLSPICYIIMGEMYPPHVKAVGSAITIAFMAATTLLATLVFPFMVEGWGRGWTFSTFMIICIIGMILSYFIVPETKGKSLTDIYKIEEPSSNDEK